jgi:saccharopine dehydrogenase-like NADP-dependent oxidoreductase
MASDNSITVFGAYGHTASFVIAELRKRGWRAILSGRDSAKLDAVRAAHPGSELRVAAVDDPRSLAAAIAGSRAVINCAGTFLDTAIPIIDVAIRSGVHYIDIAAEQAAVLNVFERFANDARTADIVIAPAVAFYGGLADLLATAIMEDWDAADEICIAVALDSWKPTRGTRLTGKRNPGRRFIFSHGKLERADPPPGRTWNFPPPFGPQEVVGLSFAEAITISRHLDTREIRAFMNTAPLPELRNPDTPPPTPADESGRSSQIFLMDVIVRRGSKERRVVASGRDIYAVTAPIVVEATERIVNGLARKNGVVAAGEAFDARDFLNSLSPAHLLINFS